MTLDQAGKPQNFPHNKEATALAKGHIFPDYHIAGDALACREIQMR